MALWQVEGIWRGPQGTTQEVRNFEGDREHIEKVLTRLEGKGRLVRRLKIKSIAPAQTVPEAHSPVHFDTADSADHS